MQNKVITPGPYTLLIFLWYCTILVCQYNVRCTMFKTQKSIDIYELIKIKNEEGKD